MGGTQHEAEGHEARTMMILAAERLFAERGIDAVPLREIVMAAGQRNASALSYHIGGREELIRAILDFRRGAVGARRVALLRQYETGGVVMDEAAIAASLILPLVELMLRDPRGGNYLRFLAQVFGTERPESAFRPIGGVNQGMRRCFALYRACYPDMAVRALRERFVMAWRGAIYALADWQRDTAVPRRLVPRGELSLFATDLITITAATLASIRYRERRFMPFAVPRTGRRATADWAAD